MTLFRFGMKTLSGAACCWLLFSAAAMADETLESVSKRLEEAGAKVKSMTATQLVDVTTETGEFKMESHTKGTYEYMRKGDTALWRMESDTATVSKVGGQEIKSDQKVLMVCDGKFNYTVTDMAGQKTAMKTAVEKKDTSIAGKTFFETLTKDNVLKLLPEDKVEGKPAYVIEATPKSKGPESSIGRTQYFLMKDSGIVAKTIMFDTAGKPMTTVLMSNLKINPEISSDRFVFKLPAGVRMMDTDAMRNRHMESGEQKKD